MSSTTTSNPAVKIIGRVTVIAGQPVAGPFTACAQANAIQHHALAGANDRIDAQLGADAKVLKEKLAAAGASDADVAKDPGVIALADARTTAMNRWFLRASLVTPGIGARGGTTRHTVRGCEHVWRGRPRALGP